MKTQHARSLVIFICNLLFITSIATGQPLYSLNGVFADSVGTPITISAWDYDCVDHDPHNTVYWDFGSSASPAKAITPGTFDGVISVHFPQVVFAYSTPGEKTITMTSVSDRPTSPYTYTFVLHIYDCSSPSIPHDAIVINSDTTVTLGHPRPSNTYWVNSGVVLNLNTVFTGQQDSLLTIFTEPGSTISGVNSSTSNCIIYNKYGSVSATSPGHIALCFGCDHLPSNDFIFNCPNLNFDYTNAPPNVARPLDGVVNASLPSLTISPNPTRGIVSVEGAPTNDLNISVLNLLGETLMELKNPHTSDFTLDLTKLVSGIYYIRFSSANSVVTKKVVRQ